MNSANKQTEAPAGKQADPKTTSATQSSATPILDEITKKVPKATRDLATLPGQLRVLIDIITREAAKVDKSIIRTIDNMIAQIDDKMSRQLAKVMHAPEFQKLEGSWRGLHYLVDKSETSVSLKLKVLNITKDELKSDLENAIEFDQSYLFRSVYSQEIGTPGGDPYGALIGDFEFDNHPTDIKLLENISSVAAAGFCPFISAASPALFGLDSFAGLDNPRDLALLFDDKEHIKWQAFRKMQDSRFVVLTMPRVLSRLPYGRGTEPTKTFNFEEVKLDDNGNSIAVPHDQYTWMNAAYVLGSRLTDSFAKYNWCTSIQGANSGGRVDGLPAHIFTTDDGDRALKCPTEVAITGRRDNELSDLGFLPLCHYKNTDYAVFFGGQTTQQFTKFPRNDAATNNARLSARLPYIMAASRISHYLSVMARDAIGSNKERDDVEYWLKNWISQYVCLSPKPTESEKAQFPLQEAQITVEETPGRTGEYKATCLLRPFLKFEALTAEMSLVASLPIQKT